VCVIPQWIMRLRGILCCQKANDGFSFLSLGLAKAQNGTSKPVSLPCIFVFIYRILLLFFKRFMNIQESLKLYFTNVVQRQFIFN